MKNIVLRKPINGDEIIVITSETIQYAFDFYLEEAVLEKVDDALHLYFQDIDSSIILDDFYATYHEEFLPRFILDNEVIEGEDFFAALEPELMPAMGYVIEYTARNKASEFDTLANGVDSLDGANGGSEYSAQGVLSEGETGGESVSQQSNIVTSTGQLSTGGSFTRPTEDPTVDGGEEADSALGGGGTAPRPVDPPTVLPSTTTPTQPEQEVTKPETTLPNGGGSEDDNSSSTVTPPTTPTFPETGTGDGDGSSSGSDGSGGDTGDGSSGGVEEELVTGPPRPSVQITTDANNDGILSGAEIGTNKKVDASVSVENAKVGDKITITDQTGATIYETTIDKSMIDEEGNVKLDVKVTIPSDGAEVGVHVVVTDPEGTPYEASDSADILKAPTIEITSDKNNDGVIDLAEVGTGTLLGKITLDETTKVGDVVTVYDQDGKEYYSKVVTESILKAGSFMVWGVTKPTSNDLTLSVKIERGDASATNSDYVEFENPPEEGVFELSEEYIVNGSKGDWESYDSVEVPYPDLADDEYYFDRVHFEEFFSADTTLYSNGAEIVWSLDGSDIVGTANGETIIEIDPNNYYDKFDIKLFAPIDHPKGADSARVEFTIPLETETGVIQHTITLDIKDDKPSVVDSIEVNLDEQELIESPIIEPGFGTFIFKEFDAEINFGADNENISIEWDMEAINKIDITTENGETVYWIVIEGMLIGHTYEDFTLEMFNDGEPPAEFMESLVFLIHPGEDYSGSVQFFKPIKNATDLDSFEFPFTITDNDGDTASSTITVNVKDYAQASGDYVAPKVEITTDADNDSLISNSEKGPVVNVTVSFDKDSTQLGDKFTITDQNGLSTNHIITQDIIDNGYIYEFTRPTPEAGEEVNITVTQTGQDGTAKGSGKDSAIVDGEGFAKLDEADIDYGYWSDSPKEAIGEGYIEYDNTSSSNFSWNVDELEDLYTSDGQKVEWRVDSENPKVLHGVIWNGEGGALKVEFDPATGKYDVTLYRAISHENVQGTNLEILKLPFTYTDKDGVEQSGSTSVFIQDDTASISEQKGYYFDVDFGNDDAQTAYESVVVDWDLEQIVSQEIKYYNGTESGTLLWKVEYGNLVGYMSQYGDEIPIVTIHSEVYDGRASFDFAFYDESITTDISLGSNHEFGFTLSDRDGDRVEGRLDMETYTPPPMYSSELAGGEHGIAMPASDDIPVNNSANVIEGTELDDILYGTENEDIIFGLDGDDTIYAGEGNNTLIGGKGSDILIGDSGKDVFSWESDNFEDGVNDIIRDFKTGDVLDLSTFGNDFHFEVKGEVKTSSTEASTAGTGAGEEVYTDVSITISKDGKSQTVTLQDVNFTGDDIADLKLALSEGETFTSS